MGSTPQGAARYMWMASLCVDSYLCDRPQRRASNTKGNQMKVSELIAELECYDADSDVHFAYGAGDYWRTVLAPKVSRVFTGTVTNTEYHGTDKLLDGDEHDDDAVLRRVVVIE